MPKLLGEWEQVAEKCEYCSVDHSPNLIQVPFHIHSREKNAANIISFRRWWVNISINGSIHPHQINSKALRDRHPSTFRRTVSFLHRMLTIIYCFRTLRNPLENPHCITVKESKASKCVFKTLPLPVLSYTNRKWGLTILLKHLQLQIRILCQAPSDICFTL